MFILVVFNVATFDKPKKCTGNVWEFGEIIKCIGNISYKKMLKLDSFYYETRN